MSEPELRDDGVTLIELVVAMAMFSTVLAFVFGLLLTVQKQDRSIQSREDSVGNARLALETMDRQIRSGNILYDPTLEALPLSMRAYTQSNGENKCVQWQVLAADKVLRTRSWAPGGALGYSDVTAWRIAARGVINSSADTTPPFSLSGAGSTTQYGSRLLDIFLRVRNLNDGAPPIEVRSSISGRNTLYGYDPGVCSPIPPV